MVLSTFALVSTSCSAPVSDLADHRPVKTRHLAGFFFWLRMYCADGTITK